MKDETTEFTATATQLPPNGVIVFTKIDDAKGRRNDALLSRQGNLWFVPDGSIYVYYKPTHWRPATKAEAEQIAIGENVFTVTCAKIIATELDACNRLLARGNGKSRLSSRPTLSKLATR